MEGFEAYGYTIASLAFMALFAAVMSPLSAIMKEKAGAAPGGTVPEDYSNSAYRWHRAFANLTETLPVFAASAVAAILAGASPFWINLFAVLFVVSRILVAVVHIRGVGKPSGGARSILFTVGWAMTILMAIFAIVAVL